MRALEPFATYGIDRREAPPIDAATMGRKKNPVKNFFNPEGVKPKSAGLDLRFIPFQGMNFFGLDFSSSEGGRAPFSVCSPRKRTSQWEES